MRLLGARSEIQSIFLLSTVISVAVARTTKSPSAGEGAGDPVLPLGHGFQNPCDGMRNARLKREDAFSHAMIIVSSAMVSSS